MLWDSFISMRGIAKKKKKRNEKYGGLKTSDETALRTLKTPFLNSSFFFFNFSVLFLAFDNIFLAFGFSSLGRMIDPKICTQI